MNITPPRESEASGDSGEPGEKSGEPNVPAEPSVEPHREISREEYEQLYYEARELRAEVTRLRTLARRAGKESTDARESEARASADVEERINQLREANENLVVATLRAQDMTEVVERAKQELSHLAHHDFLTGLPNRMMLNDRIGHAIPMAHRHGKRLAVLFLDLDHFKHINDSLGHSVGDKLLQAVAQSLANGVRSSDTVSRAGGDEFVVLLSEVEHAEDAALIAEKMLSVLTAPHAAAGHELHVSASIGISIYPDDGADSETLIRNADTAMYVAKEAGRNNSHFFRHDMNIRAVERQSLEGNLRRALERDEFVLHYQPKVNLQTGEITGVEALIRWQHPQRGLILPAQFVPIAEDSGLIVPIGRWVLGEACRQARAWIADGRGAMTMAVNISAIEFRSKGFLEGIRAILRETGLAPGCLELELTESVLMQEAESAAALLEEVKTLGVHLAIDDFGTGYSSLSYLKRFPIDVLKIDQSFVKDMTTNPDDAIIVAAVIDMGKNLHQRVIAEGVETREQLVLLQTSHCGEAQGYYFSRAMPAAQFTIQAGTDITTAVTR